LVPGVTSHAVQTLGEFVCPGHLANRSPLDSELLRAELHCLSDYDYDNDNDNDNDNDSARARARAGSGRHRGPMASTLITEPQGPPVVLLLDQ